MNDIIESRNQELAQDVVNQIDSISSFIKWTDRNLHQGRREETFKKLVNVRRNLKRLRFSLLSKPERKELCYQFSPCQEGAAVYGERP